MASAKGQELQRMQIRHQVIELLLTERAAETGHHVAAANDRLFHKLVIRNQAAGQVRFLEQPFQAGPLGCFGTVRAVANGAVKFVQATSLCLLRSQTQFSISLQLWILSAPAQQRRENHGSEDERFSLQVDYYVLYCCVLKTPPGR
jgi:hypothetical protein